MRPSNKGGVLEKAGVVEVVSSLERDGRPVFRDLRGGEMLDGEGGYTVWGKLMPAAASLKAGALPIGLAHKVKLRRDIAHGAVVRWTDVEIDAGDATIRTRRAMEAKFSGVGVETR